MNRKEILLIDSAAVSLIQQAVSWNCGLAVTGNVERTIGMSLHEHRDVMPTGLVILTANPVDARCQSPMMPAAMSRASNKGRALP